MNTSRRRNMEKILGENMTTEELIDYVNFNYPDEAVRCRILLAVVLKRLGKTEEELKKEIIEKIKKWANTHWGYSENSDLDPSPQPMIDAKELFEYLESLKSA